MSIHRFGEKADKKVLDLMRTKGKHCDGGGLYLQVENVGQGSWMFRHKTRWGSIGPASVYKIGEAREVAQNLRKEVHEGRDPYQMLVSRRARPTGKTFAEAMSTYLAAKSPHWSPSNRARELRRYEYLFGMVPDFVALPIKAIDQAAKNEALATWNGQAKKRRDVGFYIEAIIRYAETGKLRIVGGKPEQQHHEAMPYAEVPAFYARIAKLNSDDAHALRFLILTGARTDEVIGRKERGVWAKACPTWREIVDVDGSPMWIIPGRLEDDDDEEKFRGMKGKKDHSVPLSAAAMSLLGPRRADDVALFNVSNQNALLNTLKANGGNGFTVHGFRSSFSDFGTEAAGYSADLVDACIAHPSDNLTPAKLKVRKSYQRSELLAKRREILERWSDFVTGGLASLGPGTPNSRHVSARLTA